MKLASKFALLIVSACAVSFLCASSCAATEAKKQQQMAELTPEQIANMTPEEVAQYYARRSRLRAEQRRRQEEEVAESSSGGFFSKVHSVEKRERLGNVNERLKDDASNTPLAEPRPAPKRIPPRTRFRHLQLVTENTGFPDFMSITNTQYIVTGAAGFIGSAVVWGLNRRGIDDILIVDHLGESEKWKNLRALRYADYMEKDDFFRELAANGLPSNVKAVIHLGACSSTTQLDASYLVHNNFEYTKLLATLCAARGVRFIYASSAATYGAGECGYSDALDGIPALRPLNMYGYSKQMFDLWAIRNGMVNAIAGMKFTNVFGPNERHKGPMRSMVCRAFEQIRDTGTVKLFKSCRTEYADGEQKRDFVYVKDIVDMILFLLDRPDLCGIYNAGSGLAETWNELVSAVFDAMEKPRRIEYIDMPEILRGKYQYYTCADMTKLRSAGFTGGRTPLAEAVADYVRGYLLPDKYLGDESSN